MSLQKHFDANQAVIRIKPGTAAASHFGVIDKQIKEIRLGYFDLQLIAEELIEFGSAIEVVSPAALRDEIRNSLKTVVNAHA